MGTPPAAPRPSLPAPRRSRLARARARHHSVLRRRSDRRRSALIELQLLAAAVAAALCVLLSLSVYHQGRADALQQARQLRPVQARIVGQPYVAGIGGEMAQVGWTSADGKAEQGTAGVPYTGRVGDRVQIWLDASGNPVGGPAATRDTVGAAVLTGVVVVLGAWGLVAAAGAFVRTRLDRRDEEAWEREWQVYEPLWSRRR